MTPLEALEEYKKQNEYGVNVYADEYLDIIEKSLKVLEIIKEKKVNVDNFLSHIKEYTDYKEYKRLHSLYKITILSGKELTEQEFDLLKEILK